MALTNAASELMTGAEKLSSLLDDTANWDSRMQMRSSPERPPPLLLVLWVGRSVGPELPKLAFQGQMMQMRTKMMPLMIKMKKNLLDGFP
ncbi:unnamed protein product [Prunus armeniaca]|uniref:Uncharacterized protein n=1 Tax=Prunus armeniaca TaxID=36596 RepID=A0A6J5W7L9_PRUAR|nr:unnamed protein product [Prunus armeniaca]